MPTVDTWFRIGTCLVCTIVSATEVILVTFFVEDFDLFTANGKSLTLNHVARMCKAQVVVVTVANLAHFCFGERDVSFFIQSTNKRQDLIYNSHQELFLAGDIEEETVMV